MKENYITAVLQELKQGTNPEEILTGLKRMLVKRGHERLYAAILRGVVRVLEAGGASAVTVTVASRNWYDTNRTSIAQTLSTLGADTEATILTDETIIGGYIAEARAQRVDHSHKSRLVQLYRSLTS